MADLALIGLAVMGQNLILNLNDHGYKVVAFNRTVSKVENFLLNEAKNTNIIGAVSLEDMVNKLKSPKIVFLLVQAGAAVDDFIQKLIPLLKSGDIIIDGGNSEYNDTNRRCRQLQSTGIHFVGCGVSGGEDGARYGPSLMPGGSREAWPTIGPILQAIAARSSDDVDSQPCCDWLGADGCGHFVKMVHNGIEYGDMQIISEAYDLMRSPPLSISNQKMHEIFREWNNGELDSFLIEITAKILNFKDSSDRYLLERIQDKGSQKGTGKWTVISALQYASPTTLIGESVFARCLSQLKEERIKCSSLFPPETSASTKLNDAETQQAVNDIRCALYAAKIISYSQGFMLLRDASLTHEWRLDLGRVAMLWRGGCIIRSRFLHNITEAYQRDPQLTCLLMDEFFVHEMAANVEGLRRTVLRGITAGVPLPAMSSGLSFFDGFRRARLPANLVQAQRDFFGAHTFQLESNDDSTWHHANWTGHTGSAASTVYQI